MSHPFDALFADISALVLCHSPSGAEAEIDAFLRERLKALGHAVREDAAGNLGIRIPGRGAGHVAITAHKDEIGALVTTIESSGRIRVRPLGGSFPWVYGEGAVDLLGAKRTVTGVLSFGSRHVSHASPQFVLKDSAPLRWADAWVETKLEEAQLEAAGVGIGTRVVVGKQRKAPFRMGDHVAGYTLDNKASLAVLLMLAAKLREPFHTVDLIATSKEEVGAVGALYLTREKAYDAMIALEIAPIAPEYAIADGPDPVLLAQDSHGLYDEPLNATLGRIAAEQDMRIQHAVLNGFGSDGSICMKLGHVPRAACIGFPTQNTHGFEIAHLGALQNIATLLNAAAGQRLV